MSLAPPGLARPADGAVQLDIPALPVAEALAAMSRETGISIGTDGTLPTVWANPVHGRLVPADALARLLAGSGLVARQVGPRAWRIERATVPATPPRASQRRFSPQVRPPEVPPVEIVVSAAKQGQSFYDLPRAITQVPLSPAAAMDPATGSARIAFDSEGLTLTGLGPGRNRMFLRGVADSPLNGDSQSTVAVVLDDLRLTYSAPDPDLRLVDVERVELLKGPQGSLYGTGTLGGIYEIVTRAPDLDHASATFSGGAATIAEGGTGWSGAGVLNLPLATGAVGLRLAGYAENEPGWVDSGARRNSNSGRTLGGRLRLRAEIAQGWRIDLTGQFQRMEMRDSQYVYAPGVRSRPAQAAEPHDNDLDHAGLRLAGPVGGAEAVLVSGLTRHEVQDTLAVPAAPALGLPGPGLWDDRRQYRVWDSELRLTGTTAGGIRWLAGASHVEAHQNADRTLSPLPAGDPLILVEWERRTADDSALFANATVPLGSAFEVEGGGRLFLGVIDDRRSGKFGASGARELRRAGLTPSLALSWRPGGDRIGWLRYGSAFRQGGIAPAGDGTLQTFSGDELATLEAGWRQALGAGGTLDVGAHYTWWDDVQSDTLLANGLIETRNAGKARILGGEATLHLPLGHDWTVDLGATVEAARLVRNDLGIALDDRRLPVIPDYTVRGALARRLATPTGPVEARLALRFVGPARLSFAPALDRALGNALEGTFTFEMPLARGRLSLRLDNLFGSDEESFAFGNQFTALSTHQSIPSGPRRLSLSYSGGF